MGYTDKGFNLLLEFRATLIEKNRSSLVSLILLEKIKPQKYAIKSPIQFEKKKFFRRLLDIYKAWATVKYPQSSRNISSITLKYSQKLLLKNIYI